MSRKRLMQILNIVSYVIMICTIWLANRIPIGGYTTGQIAAMYPNLFNSVGVTISIWGIIYAYLGGFVIYQGKDFLKKACEESNYMNQIGWLFVISSLGNSCWILSWHYQKIGLSLIFMGILLLSLILIYYRLNINRSYVGRNEKRFVQLPFQIYLPWISIVAMGNVVTWLDSIKWNGFGISQAFWTILLIIIGALLTCRILQRRRDYVYGLVIFWTFLGIITKGISIDPQRNAPIILTTVFCMTAIVFQLNPRVKRNIS